MNRGDIYWVSLDPTQGAEIKKKRPCVILSADPINQARRTVIVIPLSTSTKAHPPITMPVLCMKKKVVAVIDQIRTVDKSRLIGFIECLNPEILGQLEFALKQVLAL